MKKISFIFLLLAIAANAVAQTDTIKKAGRQSVPLVLEYSFLDFPFATYAGKTVNCSVANPDADVSLVTGMKYKSMQQATQISTDIAQSLHWGIKQIPVFNKRPKVKAAYHALMAGALDLVTMQFPYGASWAHEEFHRNAMAVNYTNSFNPLGFEKRKGTTSSNTASVAFVLDTNLVLLKQNDNPGFVRLSAAGIESSVYISERLQQQNFFYQQKLPNSFYYVLQFMGVQSYIALCGNKEESTKETERLMGEEGSNQLLRDFTGFDLAAWAYDLWRPNEPYAARGLHPYGNGYDRYIKGTDLTDEQLKWLKKQASLSLINLISPMNIYFNSITLKKYADGSSMQGNFSFRYYPTSFGNSLGLDLMLITPKYNLFVSPHINQNLTHSFPGIEAMLFEYPVAAGRQHFLTTFDVIADLQPASHSFFTAKSMFAGYAQATVKWRATKILYPYISASAKTRGWVKGNPFLSQKAGFELGLSARFNYTMKGA